MNLYTGVVENRQDPLKLGRCQVRVAGLHSDNKVILPTEDLPWAYPMQPVTSAAMNGIGHAPVGPVEGTWVVVMFRDPENQHPVILGTIGGIPQAERKQLGEEDSVVLFDGEEQPNGQTPESPPQNAVTTSDGQVLRDGSGNPVTSGVYDDQGQPTTVFIGPLTEGDFQKYKDAVAKKESSSVPGGSANYERRVVAGAQNYGIVNTLGYTGKYQFGALALIDLGYIKGKSSNKGMPDATWTGKNGVSDYETFRTTGSIQESVMEEFTKINYRRLVTLKVIEPTMDKKEVCGWLAVAHNQGPGAAKKLKTGTDSRDGYGTSAREYYDIGYAAIDGSTSDVEPGADNVAPVGEKNPDGSISTGVSKEREAKLAVGFYDPNLKYPLETHINEPDTNRLARGRSKDTIVEIREETRDENVPFAQTVYQTSIATNNTWSQPDVPYNAKYPFNHVWQSESGHTEEWDDTPNNERYLRYHRVGTYTEIDANGTQVDFIVGDYYMIQNRNGNIHIKGRCNITIDGDANLLCQSNANIEVLGDTLAQFRNDLTARVSGTMNLNVEESLNIKCESLNIETHTGDMNVNVAGSMLTKAGTDIDVKAGGAMRSQSGGITSVKAGGAIGIDGSTIDLNSGKAVAAKDASFPLLVDMFDIPEKGEPLEPVLEDLTLPPRDIEQEQVFESPEEAGPEGSATTVLEGKQERGEVPEELPPTTTEETSTVTPNSVQDIPANCSVIYNLTSFPRTFQLSKNFRFEEIVGAHHSLVDQICGERGKQPRMYTKQEIMCNLKNTCENILEKVITVLPKKRLTVTSSYRQNGSVKQQSSTSDHPKGRAVDIVIADKINNFQEHYNLAQQLAGILPYDQLILEYRDTGRGRICWIHISYNPEGSRKQAFTMLNDRTYDRNKLVLLS